MLIIFLLFTVCGLPPEYCEYGPDFEKCKPWLKKNCPDLYPQLQDAAVGEKEGEKGAEKKGETS
jgi:density-regulated protein